MTEPQTDEQLLAAFLAGKKNALAELANRYERPLLGLASGLLGGHRELAEDAVQEAWVRVIRFASGFNGQCRFKTWVYRIAMNQCHSLLAGATMIASKAERGEHALEAPTSEPTSEGTAIKGESGERLRQEVAALGRDKSEVLLLCYHQGLTHEEAAEVLGIPLGTLKSRLSAALKELRERLPAEMKP